MGFTFDDVNAAKGKATRLAEIERLTAVEPRNAELIEPFLGGEEVNNSPTHAHHRYAINFLDLPLCRKCDGPGWLALTDDQRREALRQGIVAHDYPREVAADWPDLLAIVERLVKPERLKQSDEGGKRLWWRYLRPREEMYRAIEDLPDVLVINCGATPHMMFAQVPSNQVFAHSLFVFSTGGMAQFCTLQSRVHEIWARSFTSTLEDRLRYAASDCFETFPLPDGFDDSVAMSSAGQAYLSHRAALMVARNQGMTPTYNRFHDPQDSAEDITDLRRLHAAMDDAVLRAYGWDDLADRAAPEFLTEETEDDHSYQGRLFWPAPFRDELLARLLKLNEERAAEERQG